MYGLHTLQHNLYEGISFACSSDLDSGQYFLIMLKITLRKKSSEIKLHVLVHVSGPKKESGHSLEAVNSALWVKHPKVQVSFDGSNS